MVTVSKARKILGTDGKDKSDEYIQKELEMASFLSEIILDAFRQKDLYVKVKKELNNE